MAVSYKNMIVGVSPELAALGISPGATRRHVRQICPGAVIVEHDPDICLELANLVWDICSDYTPLVEPDELDSVFADFTGCGDVHAIPGEIIRRSRIEAQLEAAIGLSASKLIAKIAVPASGCAVISHGSERRFLAGLPLDRLWPLPHTTLEQLGRLGVRTIGELAAVPRDELTSRLGEAGFQAHLLSMGIDRSPVLAMYPPESIDCSMSFDSPITKWDDIEQCLSICSAEIASKLSASTRAASWVEVCLEFEAQPAEPDACARRALHAPSYSAAQIWRALTRAIEGKISGPVCGISVRAGGLVIQSGMQLSIFGASSADAGEDGLSQAIQSIRDRFGAQSVITANVLVRSRRDRIMAGSML